TDRCSLRCTYCMPHDFAAWLPNEKLLTTQELMMVISVAVQQGIDEVRLTGGEPLLRPDIVEIVEQIASLENAPKLTLTTNGIRLPELASPLAKAGLSRINVSLDTLSRERFKTLTYRDKFEDVILGLNAAKEAGLFPIKVNSVLLKGINDDEAPALLSWALENEYSLRFIEQMPLDAGGIWERATLITADEIFESLSSEYKLESVDARGSSPAEEFYINGTSAKVGIIGSVTRPFCGACDRLRLTSDGQLRSCLFSNTETDLRSVLRDETTTYQAKCDQIAARFQKTVISKLPGHGINDPSFIAPLRPMSAIGG
ncbi:MAG: GTP 3',8-cyclase MoaA, partial [Actinobacteria bacterium]|nr:GTP 3',8-cyclase MoaA [Actinomycetota bacterium]